MRYRLPSQTPANTTRPRIRAGVGYEFITACNKMLFSYLWRNVEASCHKHCVVVSRHQQAPPLTTSDKCHNFPRSGGAVLITPSRSQQHWQQSIDSPLFVQNRDLCLPHMHSTPPLGGGGGVPRRKLAMTFGVEKTIVFWLPRGKKILKNWRTDRHTDKQTHTT